MANAIKLTICASYLLAGAVAHKNSDRVKRIALAALVGIAASFALSSTPAILFNAVILTLAWRGFSSPPAWAPADRHVVPGARVLHDLGAGAERPPSPLHVRPGAGSRTVPGLDFAGAARRGAFLQDHPLSPRDAGGALPSARALAPPRRGRVAEPAHERSPSPPVGFRRDPSPVGLATRPSARGRSAASALHLPPAAAGGVAPPRGRAPSPAAAGGIAPPRRRDPSSTGARRDHSPAPGIGDNRR